MTGLGPFEPLLKDPTVNDICINGPPRMPSMSRRPPACQRPPGALKDEAHLIRIVNKIVSAVGRRVDEPSRCVRTRAVDGLASHAV